ncbi:MAG: DUF2284 domain-containing protein [Thermoplasmata archaeon]|nr:MAG: DUF2284 domain-containing protein [Thermoplasmata archaeon]
MNKWKLEKLFQELGFQDFKWVDPNNIKVAQWVRMKCQFGCDDYGSRACCPPNMPTKAECEEFIKEYSTGVVFHFENVTPRKTDRTKWYKKVNPTLLELERRVFLMGHPKALIIFMSHCVACKDCVSDVKDCRHPEKRRPSPEGLCIDVFTTVRELGYPIEVLTDYKQTMNRYAFLLIE